MIPLQPPEKGIAEAAVLCSQELNVHNQSRGLRLQQSLGSLKYRERQYSALGRERMLFSMRQETALASLLVGDMTWFYESKLVGGNARAFYDKLLLNARDGRCGYCCVGRASDLDHFLPKDKYAAFAITPMNLIPCCSQCNGRKASKVATTIELQLLHPYFDDIDSEVWLFATLKTTRPVTLQFEVHAPSSWSGKTAARVRSQLRQFRLLREFAMEAGRLMNGLKPRLHVVALSGGANAVRQRLEEDAVGWAEYGKNSVEAATFRALATSDWFINGGFRQVGV